MGLNLYKRNSDSYENSYLFIAAYFLFIMVIILDGKNNLYKNNNIYLLIKSLSSSKFLSVQNQIIKSQLYCWSFWLIFL